MSRGGRTADRALRYDRSAERRWPDWVWVGTATVTPHGVRRVARAPARLPPLPRPASARQGTARLGSRRPGCCHCVPTRPGRPGSVACPCGARGATAPSSSTTTTAATTASATAATPLPPPQPRPPLGSPAWRWFGVRPGSVARSRSPSAWLGDWDRSERSGASAAALWRPCGTVWPGAAPLSHSSSSSASGPHGAAQDRRSRGYPRITSR